MYIKSHLSQIQMLKYFKRLDAIDGTYINAPSNAKINPHEIACYDSHLQAMKQGEGKHIHIIEDDVCLSQNFRFIIEPFLDFQETQEWDIVFFGINVPIVRELYEVLLAQKYTENNFKVLDLQPFGDLYAGFYSYIVNRHSVNKITHLLEEGKYNLSVDMKIRSYIYENKIKAFATLPLLSIHQHNLFDTTIPHREVNHKLLLPKQHFFLAQKLFFADNYHKHQDLYKELMQYLKNKHHLVTKKPIDNPSFEEVAEYFLKSVYPYGKD